MFEQSRQAMLGLTEPDNLMLSHTPPVVELGAGLGVSDIAQRK